MHLQLLNSKSFRQESTWSFRSDGQEVEDLYCDDDLNGDDPNMQLQIAKAISEQKLRYPSHALLMDQESILSMDVPSTGPTSLRSNLTDDTDTENSSLDRFSALVAPEELAQATLITN